MSQKQLTLLKERAGGNFVIFVLFVSLQKKYSLDIFSHDKFTVICFVVSFNHNYETCFNIHEFFIIRIYKSANRT